VRRGDRDAGLCATVVCAGLAPGVGNGQVCSEGECATQTWNGNTWHKE
jgi:hypothetical protein